MLILALCGNDLAYAESRSNGKQFTRVRWIRFKNQWKFMCVVSLDTSRRVTNASHVFGWQYLLRIAVEDRSIGHSIIRYALSRLNNGDRTIKS